MTTKRRYDDMCGISRALNLVGERWALPIVRDLVLGPKRFSDLQAGLPAAGPNMLAQRLRELEGNGIVRRRTLPPPAGSQVYELTEWGKRLDPILTALGNWGLESPVEPQGELGADSAILGLRNFFDSTTAPKWTASYEIRLGRDQFCVRVERGRLAQVVRGQCAAPPAATLDTDPMTLTDLLAQRRTIAEATRAGLLTISGDSGAAERLIAAVKM